MRPNQPLPSEDDEAVRREDEVTDCVGNTLLEIGESLNPTEALAAIRADGIADHETKKSLDGFIEHYQEQIAAARALLALLQH